MNTSHTLMQNASNLEKTVVGVSGRPRIKDNSDITAMG